MKENLKKFLEAASADEALGQEAKAINESCSNQEELAKAAVELAHKHGFELEEADFEPATGELSEEELIEVAGGSICACSGFGLGPGGKIDNACACWVGGAGTAFKDDTARCACPAIGAGCSWDD